MTTLRSLLCSIALTLLASTADAECCKDSAAVIASLSGHALVLAAGSHIRKTAASLDWLAEGDTLALAPRSQAVLILANGHRYELQGGARATVSADAAPTITGPARELPALPPIPRFAAVAAASAPAPGAPRVRGGGAQMTGLYPRAGTIALAEKVTLQYKSVPEATSYRVILEDEGGNAVWNTTTEATEIPVPGGTLEAGSHYYWRVRAMRSTTEIGSGIEEFNTLSAEESLRREQFREAVRGASDDPATIALLAAVDLRLRLMHEACEELSAAIKQNPGDPSLRRVGEGCPLTRQAK
jgi:hypothetical protein